MRAAVALVLALCAALTPRVHPAHHRLPEHPHDDQGHSHCDENSPSISIYMDGWTLANKKHRHESFIPYGKSLRVTCRGEDVADLVMKKNGKKLQTRRNSFPEVEWNDGKPDLQISRFVCTDVRTACQCSVVVSVTPAVVVSATELIHVLDNYIVQYGDAMNVSCSGPAAARLVITKDGETLRTKQEDENTVEWSIKKSDLQISEYVCTDLNTNINRTVFVRVVPKLYIRFQSQNKTVTPEKYLDTDYDMPDYYYAFPSSKVEPKLYIKLQSQNIIVTPEDDLYTHSPKYVFAFGEVIELFCSGPPGVKLINLDSNQKLSLNITGTTVKSIVEIYRETVFGCVYSHYPDYKGTVLVFVRPRMELSSSSIQSMYSDWYGIKYGDPLQINCSWSDAGQLIIGNTRMFSTKKQRSTVVSNTTIMYIENKFIDLVNTIYNEYKCGIKGRRGITSSVMIEMLPEALGFNCVSRNLESLNCSWTVSNVMANFTLYHVENGHPTQICQILDQQYVGRNLYCVWYNTDSPGYPHHERRLSFLMQSCVNFFGCFNQTLLIDHLPIVKSDPPQGIMVVRTSSSGAVLRWNRALLRSLDKHSMAGTDEFLYKVEYEYELLGKEPLEANSSLVTCLNSNLTCEIQLALPCPGQSYTVRVYQRLKETIGDQFWSDPSTVSFYTDFGYIPENLNMCNWEPKETAEVLMYHNRKFKIDVQLDIQKMKGKVGLLKKNMALIRTYLDKNKQTKTGDNN